MGRDRWRWLARRWTFALLGFAAGLLWVAWWHAQALGVLLTQEDQLQSLHGQLATLKAQSSRVQQQSGAPQAPPVLLAQLPSEGRQGVIWLQLSQLLAQHAVQLRSLRPLPDVLPAPLTSQAVAVRLHAQFGDWTAVWLAMNANGPVWSIDRLRITPQDQGVDIEAVLRVWFGDGPGSAALFEPDLLHPEATRTARMKSAVFRQVPEPDAQWLADPQDKSEAAAAWRQVAAVDQAQTVDVAVEGAALGRVNPVVLSADPALWPLERVRLLGIWQQAQDSHAILAAGPHWVRARVGQQVAGHRIDRILSQEVHLLPSLGAVKVLGLAKASP